MSGALKLPTTADLATETELTARRILDDIGGLQRKQAELHAHYSQVQELDPRSPQLESISRLMDETMRLVGSLARQRTELLDGLPIIFDAQGKLCIVADQLAKDARLVDRVKERVQKVTKTLATVEQLLIKVAALVA